MVKLSRLHGSDLSPACTPECALAITTDYNPGRSPPTIVHYLQFGLGACGLAVNFQRIESGTDVEVLLVLLALAVVVGLVIWQRVQAPGQATRNAEAEGQRLVAATRARFRQQWFQQPDLTKWDQDDIHAAHIFDPDEPAYKTEFERRGLRL